MVCCTSAIPVLMGLFEVLHPYVGGASMLFSCFVSFVCSSGAPRRVCGGERVYFAMSGAVCGGVESSRSVPRLGCPLA